MPRTDDDKIYIDNVPQHIYNLHCKTIEQNDNFDLLSDYTFVAISAYLKMCLEKMASHRKTTLVKTFFVFLVPNEWTGIKEELKIVIAPLLLKAGVSFPGNPEDGISVVTELETMTIHHQLESPKKDISSCFQTENRCMMYDIVAIHNSVLISPVYFQFKEDYQLKLFNDDRYFTPKVLEILNSRRFDDFDSVKAELKQLILRDILKLETPFANGVSLPSEFSRSENTEDLLFTQIIEFVEVRLIFTLLY